MNLPIDPYSTEWPAYWAANPGLARGIGAEAAAAGGEGADKTAADAAAAAAASGNGADKGADKGGAKSAATDADIKGATSILDGDWRADLPDDLKETAKRFPSKADAIRSIIDLRKRDSQVRVPGKDAKPEEISAYRKAIGVPDKADLYEFPELPPEELTDEIKASRTAWGQRFHELGLPKDVAKSLIGFVTQDREAFMQSQVDADKAFVAEQEKQLRSDWKGEEYDQNKRLALTAFRTLAERTGLKIDDLNQIETKDGRFLMDRAEMLRIFATIGREMAEGTLGSTVTESEKDSIDDQVRNLRTQQAEATAAGDSKRANKLYQQEQALLAKKDGNKPVVGARGRMV